MKSRCNLLSCTVSILVGASAAAAAAGLPAGFSETLIAAGLSNPTAMEFAPTAGCSFVNRAVHCG